MVLRLGSISMPPNPFSRKTREKAPAARRRLAKHTPKAVRVIDIELVTRCSGVEQAIAL